MLVVGKVIRSAYEWIGNMVMKPFEVIWDFLLMNKWTVYSVLACCWVYIILLSLI
jgi:hypothetical protein